MRYINFFFSFAVVAIYGAAVSKVSLRNLVPSVYGFFAVTFAAFYISSNTIDNPVLVDKAFYIWAKALQQNKAVADFWADIAAAKRARTSTSALCLVFVSP